WLVESVATEDEQIVHEDRRAAVAMDRGVAEIVVLPDDVAVQVDGGGAGVAEVDVQAFARDNRSRAGVAVLAVDARRLAAVLFEHRRFPQDLARGSIETQSFQFLVTVVP